MSEYVMGHYFISGPKESLDKLWDYEQFMQRGATDLEIELPMLYGDVKTDVDSDNGEVESAFFAGRDAFGEVVRNDDSVKFYAETVWDDRSEEVVSMLHEYDDELDVIYKTMYTAGDCSDDERYHTNDIQGVRFPENWHIEICYDDRGIDEEYIELGDTLRRIEELTGVEIPKRLQTITSINEYIEKNVEYYCHIWPINRY